MKFRRREADLERRLSGSLGVRELCDGRVWCKSCQRRLETNMWHLELNTCGRAEMDDHCLVHLVISKVGYRQQSPSNDSLDLGYVLIPSANLHVLVRFVHLFPNSHGQAMDTVKICMRQSRTSKACRGKRHEAKPYPQLKDPRKLHEAEAVRAHSRTRCLSSSTALRSAASLKNSAERRLL